jgi:catechol 2,3-dioxygenase-like lactoylglutathione lyase family enzyme
MTTSDSDTHYAPINEDGRYAVGGVMMDRPFKIQRLGHFGFDMMEVEKGLRFYTDLLGFELTDVLDAARRMTPEQIATIPGPHKGYFMRYGSDHHAMVLFNRHIRQNVKRPGRDSNPNITLNQITWQVSSLGEISDAIRWFGRQNQTVVKEGRDMPGSNWHVYLNDPDGHTNELYYGIEQVGWDGRSKPREMHDRAFHEPPPMPQMSEWDEVTAAIARGVDINSGHRVTEHMPADYDVQGIILPRPFKVVRLGPMRLFVEDMDSALRFYTDILGFIPTESVTWKGLTAQMLRCSTDHTAVGLYPMEMCEKLGLSPHSTCLAIGMQVANYRQLRDARDFLKDDKVALVDLPDELFPGVDYVVNARDPDGHIVQLYDYMEQIGWDGKPRPAIERRKLAADWPETLEPHADSNMSEPFLGPWG